MPAYLCHGFRWHRRSIRVYIIVQNIDDAAPEWIIRRRSATALLESFYNLFDFLPYCEPPRSSSNRSSPVARRRALTGGARGGRRPEEDYYHHHGGEAEGEAAKTARRSQSRGRGKGDQSRPRKDSNAAVAAGAPPPPATLSIKKSLPRLPSPPTPEGQAAHDAADDVLSQDWSAVRLLEEYDPARLDEVSRPYAYVADYAVRIDLSAGVVEEMARYEERLRLWSSSSSSSGAKGPANHHLPPMAGPHSDETGRKKPLAASAKDARKAGGGGWLERLRDQLQRGEEIRWYVVVNGDEERSWAADGYPTLRKAGQQEEEEEEEEEGSYDDGDDEDDEVGERMAAAHESDPFTPDPQVTAAARAQAQHHAQYTHQQLLFEGSDHREREREKLRRQLGGGDLGRGGPPPPAVPEKEPPPILVPRMSKDGGGLRPKTPKTGGFRRLFGRGSSSKGAVVEGSP